VPTPSRNARIIGAVLWLGLVALAFVAPPPRPDLLPWLKLTALGYWIGQEALLVATFWLVGLSALVAAGVLGPALRARPLPAWPFALGAFAIGGFALLPWLVLSGDGGAERAPLPAAIGGVGGRRWGLALSLISGAALGAGLWWGDPIGLLAVARSDGFAFVMSFDFVALWLTTLLLVRRRSASSMWLLALVPVLGPSLWMASGRR
jgi:hypothetical protein